MTMVGAVQGRTVKDVVDGGGLYFSRMATAGPYAFVGGVAADESGSLAPEAVPAPPYAISPPAHVVAQTKFTFSRYKALLEEVGSGINEMLQVEQYIPYKKYADGYIDTSRGKGFMDKGRPTSALLATGDLQPKGAVINATGIAVIPDGDGMVKEIAPATEGYTESLTQEEFGDTYAEEGPFNEVVSAGGYTFTVGDIPNDWALGAIPPGVRVDPFVWWGSEIRNETDFMLARLKGWLERVEAGLEDVVHVSVYLIDMEDLFELDRAWAKWFPENPPGRTVIPTRGLGMPRYEGEKLGHKDNAAKSEFIARTVRPGYGYEKEVVSTGFSTVMPESEAVKAGPLLWVSGQYALEADGSLAAPDTAGQLEFLFKRLADICEAGGTNIDQLVRLRAFLLDPSEATLVYAALKKAIPSDPPTVAISGCPGPMPYPGATVLVDAVANVPG